MGCGDREGGAGFGMMVAKEGRLVGADWIAMRAEYITTDTSYRKLAEKYGVSGTQVSNRGKAEKWPEERERYLSRILAKSVEKSGRKKADQLARIDRVTDKLLDKLEKAVEELEIHLVTNTRKEKVIEYNNDRRPDKPTKEVIHENEEIVQVTGIVDKAGLRQISAALKDIKEIKMLRTQLDEQEQKARIANLERQANKEEAAREAVEVILDGGLEDYVG